ncbi:cyclic nucleotide-binding domain-containing protein [Exilibacterium tricleocarpae]|uniref:Cyclic nucleotide-binding domain-containing protein n=1 Tax=Exilibacterium tricleocarpae TaxID=2591008 RepID=A0A545TUW3_9GAMM|nr:cyclic nucleotide-binding domain-containing protein [Exilibacterium tricleocarpae]TQV81008.1 cyclic nucleotide-binding domain-containing protein [Exilibacterium tricleocarpae]
MLNAPQSGPVPSRPELALTRSLVPLKSMSENHLAALLDTGAVLTVCAGQVLFERDSRDATHVYLLHGDVALADGAGRSTIASARTQLYPLAHRRRRAATAVAKTDCSILRLDSEALDKLLAWSQISEYLLVDIAYQRDLDEDVDWMMTVLKSNLFFKVPPINVQQIFSRLSPMVVDAGEVILRQGEIGDGCYFIKEGSASVTRSPDGVSKPLPLADIGPGRCFGEDALVNAAVRNATVTMQTGGVVMRLEKKDFILLLREPEVDTLEGSQLAGEVAAGTVMIDVRTEEEYARSHVHRAVNIPLNLLRIKSRLLNQATRYVIYCNTGRRGRAAAYLLNQQGFQTLALAEGIHALDAESWARLRETEHSYVLRNGQVVQGQ